MGSPRSALAPGSISIGLYRRPDATPDAAVELACEEARLAEEAGFDGVTFSEHHMGFGEHFPNPLLISAFALGRTRAIWAGPLPMLLTLRPPAVVAEDIAWLAARYGGRVAVGFAAGNRPEEHALHEATALGVTDLFARGLRVVAEALGTYGDPRASLVRGDPAVDGFRGRIPMVSAGRSRAAVRRAAAYGLGMLYSPLSSPAEMHRLTEEYAAVGGTGRRVLIYSVCVSPDGTVPDDLGRRAAWSAAGGVAEVVDRLVAVIRESGADALNLRFIERSAGPDSTREQIATLGASGGLSILREALVSAEAAEASARRTAAAGR